ncbi:hypothetical protein SAMN06265380_1311 [Ruegeria faecimaris]|uniref:Uncharacterized protein n=1 Tax=Ruegeria faecimaris TaxID=686389 RepID=A0A521FMA5_9RHOB|nr:hypothetical protein SAMN06265380_1311 [Ruegeria faecimaris]
MKSSVCMCSRFHQKPKAVQTVKLTLYNRRYRSRYLSAKQ